MKENESIRLRTEPGSSININVKIEQEFDTIDFLSLKLTQQEAYRNFCSDYGVIAGRVIANDGFGVANAKISVFIPLSSEDEEDPIISSLYPYFTPRDVDGAGIRYNLLPQTGKSFTQKIKIPNTSLGDYQDPVEFYARPDETTAGSYAPGSTWEIIFDESVFGVGGYSVYKRVVLSNFGPEIPVGTFPSKTKMLNNNVLLEIYDKYYTYTTTTNGSGDYMIFGVPTGVKTLHMDVDFSDIGGDSLIPSDFINDGTPESQFNLINGTLKFKSNTNLDSLPQIESQNISVEVIPFWGNTEQCEIGITRQDFNLTKQINPSALLVFEAFANGNTSYFIKTDNQGGGDSGCGSGGGNDDDIGNIQFMTNLGVGVEACKANIADTTDFLPTRTYPDGKVIYTIPMYNERKITNEFGDLVDSDDPDEVGIPTAGKYNIFVYSLTDNIFFRDEAKGYGTHLIREVNYRYDIENQKRLVYTVGTASQLHSGNSNKKTNAIVVNGGNNLRFPSTYKFGNDIVFSCIDGFNNENNYPVVHGSLYFRKFESTVDGQDDPRFCHLTVRDGRDYFYGQPPTASNFMYQGSISQDSGPRNPTYGALNITNLLKLFKPFGGSLSETSADNFLFNGQNTNPGSTEVEISNQTYPITSSDVDSLDTTTGEVDNIPVGLDTIVDPSSPRYTEFNTKIVRVGKSPNSGGKLYDLMGGQKMGEKSKEGRYFFYFGLKANNTVLTKLKSFIGV